MTAKRQIKGQQYNISELVQTAIAAANSQSLNLEKARKSLEYLGNKNPSNELIARYARETAVLSNLARATGAYGFERQIGKINLSTTEKAIAGVESYLNRRNAGNHARWTASRKGY